MIRIPETLLEEILSHAKDEAPREVCGWLAGSLRSRRNGGDGGSKESGMGRGPGSERFEPLRRDALVEMVYPVVNVAEEPKARFVMEPEAQLAAMREIRDSGLELLGTYHSHPGSPAYPSERDGELALYPALAHLIVSLVGGGPDFRCFRITEFGIFEVERGMRLM